MIYGVIPTDRQSMLHAAPISIGAANCIAAIAIAHRQQQQQQQLQQQQQSSVPAMIAMGVCTLVCVWLIAVTRRQHTTGDQSHLVVLRLEVLVTVRCDHRIRTAVLAPVH